MGFVIKPCRSKPRFSPLAAVLSRESPLSSLCLSFLTWKLGLITIIPTSEAR